MQYNRQKLYGATTDYLQQSIQEAIGDVLSVPHYSLSLTLTNCPVWAFLCTPYHISCHTQPRRRESIAWPEGKNGTLKRKEEVEFREKGECCSAVPVVTHWELKSSMCRRSSTHFWWRPDILSFIKLPTKGYLCVAIFLIIEYLYSQDPSLMTIPVWVRIRWEQAEMLTVASKARQLYLVWDDRGMSAINNYLWIPIQPSYICFSGCAHQFHLH